MKHKKNKYVLNGLDLEEGIPDEENPEWTEEDFKNAKPFNSLPRNIQKAISVKSKQDPIILRLNQKIGDKLRATGRGWQTRANKFLLNAVEQGLI